MATIINTVLIISCIVYCVTAAPNSCTFKNKTKILSPGQNPTRVECEGMVVKEIWSEIPAAVTSMYFVDTAIEELNSTALSRFTNLRVFSIVKSLLHTLEEGVFDHLGDTLLEIILDNNNLQYLPQNIFTNLRVLAWLQMNNNGLVSLGTTLNGLGHLQVLRAKGNIIMAVSTETFVGLSSIKHIDLRENALQTVNFSNLHVLETVRLSGNLIGSVDDAFHGAAHLREITLYDNNISTVSPETFTDLLALREINMENNKIRKLEAGTFRHTKNLTVFHVSSNPLEDIDHALPLDLELHVMNLSHCSFKTFPKYLPRSLQFIDLSYNSISKLSGVDIEAYTKLNALMLEGNSLEHIGPGTFENSTSLHHLVLQNNQLREMPDNLPSCVKSIQVDNNAISFISQNAFQSGTELTILSLRHNKMNYLDPGTFQNVKSIAQLHLDSNHLQMLGANMFHDAHVVGLKKLYLNRLKLMMIVFQCFNGLTSLEVLEMSFVVVHFEIPRGSVFTSNISTTLRRLALQESPKLAKLFLSGHDLTFSLLEEVNLKRNNLKALEQTLVTKLMPNVKRVLLDGNLFHCTDALLWLPKFDLHNVGVMKDFEALTCWTPASLRGRYLDNITRADVQAADYTSTTIDVATSTLDPDADFLDTVSVQPFPDKFDTGTNHPFDYGHTDYYQGYDYYQTHDYDTPPLYDDTPYLNDIPPPLSLPTTDSPLSTEMSTGLLVHHSGTTLAPAVKTTTHFDQDNTVAVVRNDEPTQPSSQTFATTPQVTSPSPTPRVLRDVGIVIGTAVVVAATMTLITLLCYKCYKGCKLRYHDDGSSNVEGQDYVFIAPTIDKTDPKVHPKLSRAERGSTTSRASEDITNQIDSRMKVYTLDVDA